MSSRAYNLFSFFGFSNWANQVKQSSNVTKKGLAFIGATLISGGLYLKNKSSHNQILYHQIEANMKKSPLDLNSLVRLFNDENVHQYSNPLKYMRREVYEKVFLGRQLKVTGFFDHSKEIKIPTNDYRQKGYYIFTPFYYVDYERRPYEEKMGKGYEEMDMKDYIPKNFHIKGAVIVNRGL